MTVRELIEELEQLPQDLTVVTDYKEITTVEYCNAYYLLNNCSKQGYSIEPVIVLE